MLLYVRSGGGEESGARVFAASAYSLGMTTQSVLSICGFSYDHLCLQPFPISKPSAHGIIPSWCWTRLRCFSESCCGSRRKRKVAPRKRKVAPRKRSRCPAVPAGMEPGQGALAPAGEQQGMMEDGKVHSASGLFAYLEMLEAQAHEAAVKQEEIEQQEEKLAMLKKKVQELRLQRDELRAKVDLQGKGQLGKEGVMLEPAQPSSQAVLEWKIKSVKAMLQIFYLTGISGKLTKRGVCFCISTAYEGTYLDSYYLDLLIKPEVQIYRHSIPVFIPLEQIAKKYLQTDIRRFLSVLSDHLNAYVGRRFQADRLQEQFPEQIEGPLQRNSLCNLLVFKYYVSSKSKTFSLTARLLYGDLCHSLPTEAIVSCTHAPASLAETAAAHSDLFRRMALHKAFRSFSTAPESAEGAA
ncbi:centromere protein O isoform X1 [Cuculus canorus]|uniref:centromere protein O isoform X1 n=1 Tax=Cuculus canorus TaxID=55661 RepID=UPI0023AB219D|nr:centromere protein O isoform X1 [Cuculus canorus]